MSILAYRIVKKKYESHLFDGEGAYRYGGRWNSPRRRVIYCAGSRSLAILEILVHLEDHRLLPKYVMAQVEIPEHTIETLPFERLPNDWSDSPTPDSTRDLGDIWIEEARSAVLAVPSAIVPNERIYLINPDHSDFDKLKLGEPQPFEFDPRLLKIAGGKKSSGTRTTKKKKT